jgi:F-type H+-transporting ATPase subunit delta
MQGASRASLSAATQDLEALLSSDGVSGAAERTALGEGLFALAHLLDRSGALRRAATDPTRSGHAKADLMRRLLQGKVSGPTLDLVQSLVRGRWSNARDLADAAEHLGAVAVAASAEAEGRLDDVEDQLFSFGRTIAGTPDLQAALADRRAPADRKEALVTRLLEGRAAPETVLLARQAGARPRGRSVLTALEAYGDVTAQRRERLVAEVLAAVPLTEEQRERLGGALERIYGTRMQLNVAVDPSVVGGVRLRIGDEVLDATVTARLAEARRRLAG